MPTTYLRVVENGGTKHIQVRPYFANPAIHPYNELEWERRTAEIKNYKTGESIFKQDGVDFPVSWSQTATNIVASKYFYGDVDNGNGSPKQNKREYSLQQLIDRVVDTIITAGVEQGIFDKESAHHYGRELKWLLVNQYGAFNSPVWFNVGIGDAYGIKDPEKGVFGVVTKQTSDAVEYVNGPGKTYDKQTVEPVDSYLRPQASACFIIGLEDSVEAIWELMSESARLFKYGSGVGSDWSKLRSKKDKLSGGGQPSGPVSFMQVRDSTAGTIQSGYGYRIIVMSHD